jgi:hypothetical protein
MTEFYSGDIVRVEMPRGYSVRGVLGISLMFTTHAEAKFEGAIGTITEIDPLGPQSVAQYLVDFRTHDNSRVGIPWQAQWFREEWLALVERPAVVSAAATRTTPDSTWPEKPVETTESADSEPRTESASADVTAGIAHPEAKLYTEGVKDFAPPGFDPEKAGKVPDAAYGFTSTSSDRPDNEPTETVPDDKT